MGLLEWLTGRKAAWKEKIDAGAKVIDVRSPGEFSSGHVKGSQNIPLEKIGAASEKLKKEGPLVLCCASGTRSAMAKSILKSKGLDVYNGGSWRSVANYKASKP